MRLADNPHSADWTPADLRDPDLGDPASGSSSRPVTDKRPTKQHQD
jgi:hypothetical protein